jgi:ATP phosphoribosyltransferase
VGIVGLNLLEERRAREGGDTLSVRVHLGFARCHLSMATRAGRIVDSAECLRGLRIATSHPAILSRWLRENGVEAKVLLLSSTSNLAPDVGDVVCDLVSTGTTLSSYRFREAATLMQSEAVLVGPRKPFEDARALLAARLERRLKEVLPARPTDELPYQSRNPGRTQLLRATNQAPRNGTAIGRAGRVETRATAATLRD